MGTEAEWVDVAVAADRIDIAGWLFRLGGDDYRGTARAHLGAGTYTTRGGRRAFFDTERFLAAFVVNHHVEQDARPDYVRVRSENSRAWILGLLPIRLVVTWEMRVRPSGPERSNLECRLTIDPRRRALEPLAKLAGVRLVQRRHLREQTAGFAADIARKHGDARVGARPAAVVLRGTMP